MLEIEINAPPGLGKLGPLIARTIPDIVEQARAEMIQMAHEELHTTAEDYIGGIQPPKYHVSGKLPNSGPVASITLTGWLPNAIEGGWAGGDMKPWLLAGRNAKVGADGKRYNTVPFRHGTPGSRGTHAQPMGSAFSKAGRMSAAEAKKLGKRVYDRAKKLEGSRTSPGGKTRWGERLKAGHAPKLKDHHVTDIYAGMVKMQKFYAKATQSQYMTFRRVSENSKPEAWIHPGIEGVHIFDKIAERIPKIASFLIQQAVAGASS